MDKKKIQQEFVFTMTIVAIVLGAFFPTEWVNSSDALVQLIRH